MRKRWLIPGLLAGQVGCSHLNHDCQPCGDDDACPRAHLAAREALQAPLAARFDVVRVENDAVGALEAERRWGVLQGIDHCAYVTWSTGIGVGLCVDGRVLHGKNGNAGHAGHAFVSDDDSQALCGCGNVGDVEGLVAGNAIARRFERPAEDLFAAALAGDAAALARVDAQVIIALRTDVQAFFQLRAIQHGIALRTFLPEPLWHAGAAVLVFGAVQRRNNFIEPTHDRISSMNSLIGPAAA